MQFDSLGADSPDELEALVAGVQKVGLEAVEWLDADLPAPGLGVAGQILDVLHHHCPFLFLLRGLDCVRLAHYAVNRADQRGTAQRQHLLDQCLAVLHGGLLFLRRASKIPARPHAGAD